MTLGFSSNLMTSNFKNKRAVKTVYESPSINAFVFARGVVPLAVAPRPDQDEFPEKWLQNLLGIVNCLSLVIDTSVPEI